MRAGNAALAARLNEAADWLADDIPHQTPVIEHPEGDVSLDALDLYCVNLMREAASTLSNTQQT